MAKTISIRWGENGKVKSITPGAGPVANLVAKLGEQENLKNMGVRSHSLKLNPKKVKNKR